MPSRNAHNLPGHWREDGWPTGTFNRRLQSTVKLAGPLAQQATLVRRASHYTRCWEPKEVGPEDPSLLPDSGGEVWGPPNSGLHCTPAPKCLTQSRFLPDDPTYWDIWQQLLLLTLAYIWALQYWVEKVNPQTLDTYCPLAMSVVELKWWVERHIAFSKWDVFSGLEDAILNARSQNAEASPKGTITLPIASDIGGVEPLPATTHGTDNTIIGSPECTPYDGAPPAKQHHLIYWD